jgi:hypothetical protein
MDHTRIHIAAFHCCSYALHSSITAIVCACVRIMRLVNCVCVCCEQSGSKKKSPDIVLGAKSSVSAGSRYREGQLMTIVAGLPESNRVYLFEHFIG